MHDARDPLRTTSLVYESMSHARSPTRSHTEVAETESMSVVCVWDAVHPGLDACTSAAHSFSTEHIVHLVLVHGTRSGLGARALST